MRTYKDIYTYYPKRLIKHRETFPDFAIFSLADLSNATHEDEHFKILNAPHHRDFFEICIGVKKANQSTFNVGNAMFENENKHMIFVSPLDAFSIKFDHNEKLNPDVGYVIAFKSEFLLSKKRNFEILNNYRYFNSYCFPQHRMSMANLNPMIELAELMKIEYQEGKAFSREVIGGYLEVMLNKLNRTLNIQKEVRTSSTCETIATNFERKIIEGGNKIKAVGYYANNLNISPSYLSECTKKVTGKTAKQVLTNHKLIVARSLLEQKDKTIAEIAFEMEFSEPTNFTKFFKKSTGKTPNQFRGE